MFTKLDFLAIGDVVTDAFIRIKDAHINCDLNHEDCQLCLNFGDKVPYEFVEIVRAVGNSANAAVAASRLGLTSALLSDIGDDLNGKECLAELKKNKVVRDFITIHKNMETNYHYVLWYGNDRTILVKHQEYPYKVPAIQFPKWVYLSSLAENSLSYHEEILARLKESSETKLVFQPGTFQMKMGVPKLKGLYEQSYLFFCNVNEARRILKQPKDKKVPIGELLKKVRGLGPEIVVITDGPKGAYVYDGNEAWFMPPYPDPKPPYSRTGAGDAFASTFTSALILGKTIKEALSWAPINSMSVVQEIGAQKGLLSREKLLEYLASAPADYKPRKLSA